MEAADKVEALVMPAPVSGSRTVSRAAYNTHDSQSCDSRAHFAQRASNGTKNLILPSLHCGEGPRFMREGEAVLCRYQTISETGGLPLRLGSRHALEITREQIRSLLMKRIPLTKVAQKLNKSSGSVRDEADIMWYAYATDFFCFPCDHSA